MKGKRVLANMEIVRYGSGARCIDCERKIRNKDGTYYCKQHNREIDDPYNESCRFIKTSSDSDDED